MPWPAKPGRSPATVESSPSICVYIYADEDEQSEKKPSFLLSLSLLRFASHRAEQASLQERWIMAASSVCCRPEVEEGDAAAIAAAGGGLLERKSTAAAHCGDDLLLEIFSRLPTRALFRFRCLSKGCCAMIDEEVYAPLCRAGPLSAVFFSDVHSADGRRRVVSRHALIPPASMAGDDSGKKGPRLRFRETDMALGFLPHGGDARNRIVDSSNGLLLIDLGEREDYVVCNPATRRWVAVPKPTTSRQLCPSVALDFDPQSSPFFTIARLGNATGFRGRTVKRLSVFCSETGRWVDRGDYEGHAIGRKLVDGFLLMFGYHAIACGGALYVPEVSLGFIARFDLATGACSTMDYPPKNENWAEVRYTGVIGGRLHVAAMSGPSLGVLQVWVLNRWGSGGEEGWQKKHRVDIRGLVRAWGEEGRGGEKVSPKQMDCRFLGFHPQLDVVVFVESMGKIFACHLLRKCLEQVCDLGDGEVEISPRFGCFFPYTPSLLGCRRDKQRRSELKRPDALRKRAIWLGIYRIKETWNKENNSITFQWQAWMEGRQRRSEL